MTDRDTAHQRVHALVWRQIFVIRAGLLFLVTALALVRDARTGTALLSIVLLAGAGAVSTRWPPPLAIGWTAAGAEVVVCALAVIPTGGARSALLPYLLAPALCLGLLAGARAAVLVSGLGAVALVGVRLTAASGDDLADYTSAAAQWIVLGLAAGLLAAWVRQLLLAASLSTTDSRYAEAVRLLLELRGVTRDLPGTLDTVSTAQDVLDLLLARVPHDSAGVLLSNDGEHLVPVAVRGVERAPWPTSLRSSSALARAALSGEPVIDGALLALPWTVGGRVAAVVACERGTGGWHDAEAADAASVLEAAAVRLETALIFDDVRSVATVEERRRLGREIHDGIAQELVYLGYEMDAAADDLDADPGAAAEALRRLRTETSRMIGELRLSVYDLRTTVDGDRGLAAALSDHVRKLGSTSDLTVHLTLAQSGQRLPATTEIELLRIAQEAMSNARRHAGASNLWVELVVEPPMVGLRIEDDGTGVDSGHGGSGLAIMRERALRIGAEFVVRPRPPHGTCVSVLLRGHP